MSGYTTTPNLGLRKPTVGGDDDAWGGDLNVNADTLDTQIATKTYTDARRRRWLASVTASIPNVGASTAEEVGVVWTLPAGLLANVGDIIHLVAKIECLGTTDSKAVRVRLTTTSNGLGGVIAAANNMAVAGTTHSIIECWVMKTAANAQKAWYWTFNASNNLVNGDQTGALADSGALYLSLTMQNSTAAAPGSITIFAATVEFLPAV